MRNSNRASQDDEIQELTSRITQLHIQQQRLEQRLTRVQRRIEGERVEARHEQSRRTGIDREAQPQIVEERRPNDRGVTSTVIWHQRERVYNATFEPQIGDRVRIINPRNGQHPWEAVQGYCRDGKQKIYSNQGQLITHMPKNVRVQTIKIMNIER